MALYVTIAIILGIVLLIVVLLILLKIYLKLSAGKCNSTKSLAGKTVIVTGANTGIGYEAALDLAGRRARVILACRDQRKAEEARVKIAGETGNPDVVVKILDMSSFESVRNFVDDVNATEERLDILVNNAGVYLGSGDKRTKDDHPWIIQVNYYSGFLLTNLLIGLLKRSQPSRVVNVASSLARAASGFDVKQIDSHTTDFRDYCWSKLCNVLFNVELAKRLEGTEVTTYALCPGAVSTDALRDYKGCLRPVYVLMQILFFKTAKEGAQTTIYCSVEEGIEKYNGEMFSDCKRISLYRTATEPGLSKRLWEATEEIVHLRPHDKYF